jgi:hypothetical protein
MARVCQYLLYLEPRAGALLGGTGRVAGSPEARGREKRTFAFARTDGGMILSGPKDCRGSTKDARILPVFLHSPAEQIVSDVTVRPASPYLRLANRSGRHVLTPHGRGQGVVE